MPQGGHIKPSSRMRLLPSIIIHSCEREVMARNIESVEDELAESNSESGEFSLSGEPVNRVANARQVITIAKAYGKSGSSSLRRLR